MTNTIEPAGYIVHDTGAYLIHGYGPTEDEAWADMLNTLQAAHIELLDDDDANASELGNWITRSDLNAIPATAALLQLVEDHGGNCNWERVDGVACTDDEAAEA